jgi:hypothetical protein
LPANLRFHQSPMKSIVHHPTNLSDIMRFVFRRNKELPESIRSEFNKYFHVGGDNLLTDESELSLVYQKEGSRYRCFAVY